MDLVFSSELIDLGPGPPYKGGRVPRFTAYAELHMNTESYSRCSPSKLVLRVVLGLQSLSGPFPSANL